MGSWFRITPFWGALFLIYLQIWGHFYSEKKSFLLPVRKWGYFYFLHGLILLFLELL